MTLLKMGCWEAGPGPGCGPGGAHPLEVWVRINSAFLALLKAVVTLSPGPALPYTELYYVPPTLLHLSRYLNKIIIITASQGRDSYIPRFYMDNGTQSKLAYGLMSGSVLEPRSLAAFYQVRGDSRMDKGWDQTCPGGKYSKKGSGCWQILLVPQGPCPAFAEDGWWQPALAPGPPASSSVQACQCWALNTAPGAASCLRSTCCLCPSAAQLLQTLPWAPLPKTDACVGRKEGRLLEPISDLWRGGAVVWGPHEQCSQKEGGE